MLLPCAEALPLPWLPASTTTHGCSTMSPGFGLKEDEAGGTGRGSVEAGALSGM